MRSLTLLCFAFFVCSMPVLGQAHEEDPYALKFVETNLRIASTMPGGPIPSVVKDFQRLGDGVSIALLKILEQQDLTKPSTVESFLPLIRDAFSFPSIISVEANKKPKVTLFLLKYLEQNVSSQQARRDIQQTIKFVKDKTGS